MDPGITVFGSHHLVHCRHGQTEPINLDVICFSTRGSVSPSMLTCLGHRVPNCCTVFLFRIRQVAHRCKKKQHFHSSKKFRNFCFVSSQSVILGLPTDPLARWRYRFGYGNTSHLEDPRGVPRPNHVVILRCSITKGQFAVAESCNTLLSKISSCKVPDMLCLLSWHVKSSLGEPGAESPNRLNITVLSWKPWYVRAESQRNWRKLQNEMPQVQIMPEAFTLMPKLDLSAIYSSGQMFIKAWPIAKDISLKPYDMKRPREQSLDMHEEMTSILCF